MKKRKYTFPEPQCRSCPHYQEFGTLFSPTRYCGGFKRRKPKRFRSSDPALKIPRWCPRRLSPMICRIYGFADECAEYMEKLPIANFDPKESYIYPIGSHSAGKLMKNTPSWFSFRNYFYSRGYHKQPRKVISRSGLTNYQRNERPVFGASSDWRSATKWTLPRRTFTWFPAMTAAE